MTVRANWHVSDTWSYTCPAASHAWPRASLVDKAAMEEVNEAVTADKVDEKTAMVTVAVLVVPRRLDWVVWRPVRVHVDQNRVKRKQNKASK